MSNAGQTAAVDGTTLLQLRPSDQHPPLPAQPGDGGGYTLHLTPGALDFYHYLCDGMDDRGWGCGYRTLQSICSWLDNRGLARAEPLPSVHGIQRLLVDGGVWSQRALGSRDWIGTQEAWITLDALYSIPCRALSMNSGRDIAEHIGALVEHFDQHGAPVMCGGTRDNMSRALLGVATREAPGGSGSQFDVASTRFLILDPHYVAPSHRTPAALADITASGRHGKRYFYWGGVEHFEPESAYTLCCPIPSPAGPLAGKAESSADAVTDAGAAADTSAGGDSGIEVVASGSGAGDVAAAQAGGSGSSNIFGIEVVAEGAGS